MEIKNRMAADIGGTFTDLVLECGNKRFTHKILTTPAAPERAVIEGIKVLIGKAEITPDQVDVFIHGTTLATNAILERKGAATALVATRGFRDILEIGDEGRYDQYDIFLEKPKPIVPRHLRFTVPERLTSRGEIILPIDEAAVMAIIPALRQQNIKSIAIALLHSYANDIHEKRIKDILKNSLPDLYITLSSEVCPEIREYERTSTACANAYVQPVMAGYLGRLAVELEKRGFSCPLYLMSSGGGLTTLEAAQRFPIRLVESGPAGGAIFASHIAKQHGIDKLLSFDMGGTTAKVCLIENGKPETSRSFEVDRTARFVKGSGLPLRIPVIEMVEIGAGGGSLAKIDIMKRIAVGPESAGSVPGPACYPNGGDRPAVTDANLILGRLDPNRFAGGSIRLNPDNANRALERHIGMKIGADVVTAAFGVCEIVEENMSNAVRVHTVERGKAMEDHTMMAFGGGAPLHAVRMGEKLGVDTIIIPPNAGVGSAVGFLRAPVSYEVVRSKFTLLDSFDAGQINALIADMEKEATDIVSPGALNKALVSRRGAYMRYVGQGHEIMAPLPERPLVPDDCATIRTAFEREYQRLFSRTLDAAGIEIMTWTVTVSAAAAEPAITPQMSAATYRASPCGEHEIFDHQTASTIKVAVYNRCDLRPGATCSGPCLIVEDETTTFVSASYRASINEHYCIVLKRLGDSRAD